MCPVIQWGYSQKYCSLSLSIRRFLIPVNDEKSGNQSEPIRKTIFRQKGYLLSLSISVIF